MPTKKIAIKKNTVAPEDLLKTITDQLHKALPTLSELLGEKKFEKRIKKAAKLLVAGINKNATKKPVVATKKITPASKKAVKNAPKG